MGFSFQLIHFFLLFNAFFCFVCPMHLLLCQHTDHFVRQKMLENNLLCSSSVIFMVIAFVVIAAAAAYIFASSSSWWWRYRIGMEKNMINQQLKTVRFYMRISWKFTNRTTTHDSGKEKATSIFFVHSI